MFAVPIPSRNLKAFAARGELQVGVKGGSFYLTAAGTKIYTSKPPAQVRIPLGNVVQLTSRKYGGSYKGGKTPPMEAAVTTSRPRVKDAVTGKLRPSGGAGVQLEAGVLARLKELGVSKLPPSHIESVQVSANLHTSAANSSVLLKWKDDKGRPQYAYSAEFNKQNADKKWDRVLKNRPKVAAALDTMRSKAEASPAHAAALLMALTSLRPGSDASVVGEGHYGATTIEARHIKFAGGKATLEFVGKQGKVNKSVVDDPALVRALQKNVEGKGPKDRVFDVPTASVRAAVPSGVKLKDLRTIGATNHAEHELKNHVFVPTGNDKKDARAVIGILKAVSTKVSERLNNSPAMARKSYIAPQVIRAWAERQGGAVKKEWVEL